MNEKELAQKILDESKHWIEMQYNMKSGITGSEAYYRNQAQARLELLEHIKKTFIEMRENA